jgi:hypothetical protein
MNKWNLTDEEFNYLMVEDGDFDSGLKGELVNLEIKEVYSHKDYYSFGVSIDANGLSLLIDKLEKVHNGEEVVFVNDEIVYLLDYVEEEYITGLYEDFEYNYELLKSTIEKLLDYFEPQLPDAREIWKDKLKEMFTELGHFCNSCGYYEFDEPDKNALINKGKN